MLSINGINKGIVIDHIKPGFGIKIFRFLKLDDADYRVALIMNVPSKKMGKKDIIKIENIIDMDLDILGLIDSNITINIIDNEKVKDKYRPKIPINIKNIIKCRNPRCITSTELNIDNNFILINKRTKKYSCIYCDDIIKVEDLK